jgi:hypothetical protein
VKLTAVAAHQIELAVNGPADAELVREPSQMEFEEGSPLVGIRVVAIQCTVAWPQTLELSHSAYT